ncbi:MAG: tRNA pseudouridine(55) synthase TruB, partial [Proteobacteria bacterium]|nr:tRNA pseudouridine(55) synthase TruB [Pseudomonadota bacterium]
DIAGLCRVYGGGGRFLGVGERDNDGRLAPRRVFAAPDGP